VSRRRHNVYRDGLVHVCAELCSTCIFRPGNLMALRAGRVRTMVDAARADGSAIVCHSTLHTGADAVCRGFYDRWPTTPLQLAERMGRVIFEPPPSD
jgi:hypothetical protein